MILRRLPQYFQALPDETRRAFETQLTALLSPLDGLDHRMLRILQSVLNPVEQDDETQRLQLALLGLIQNFIGERLSAEVPPDLVGRLSLFYPFYTFERGTLRGLQDLLRVLLPGAMVSIEERCFPRPPVRVGVTRLSNKNQGLHHEDSDARSLMIVVEEEEATALLRPFLELEMPVGLRAFVVAHTRPALAVTAQAVKTWHTLGERL